MNKVTNESIRSRSKLGQRSVCTIYKGISWPIQHLIEDLNSCLLLEFLGRDWK